MKSRIVRLLEQLRCVSFWFFDLVKGRPIKKHYEDIRFVFENYNSEKAVKKRNSNLEKLLSYAKKNTEFYRDFSDIEDIAQLPVVDKNIIRNNFSRFVSKKFSSRSLKQVTTSGSTGTPFSIYQDKNKVLRHKADNIFLNELANHSLGTRLYYLRIWERLGGRGSLIKFMQNVKTVDATSISDAKISELLSNLRRDKSTKSLLAYASHYVPLVQYIRDLDTSDLQIDLQSIISMSEALPDITKHQLEDIFKCPVVSRYSNMENGFIAQQCIDGTDEYYINAASFYVEILEIENDYPVKAGEIGRIVVTDLFNYAMPLIRYDTGDIGSFSTDSDCKLKTPVLSKVEGRRVDLINDLEGNIISPFLVVNTMWQFPHVMQFQFIQETKSSYRLVLNTREKETEKEIVLVSNLKKHLGEKAEICIEYVNEIPLLASGKRKQIINATMQ